MAARSRLPWFPLAVLLAASGGYLYVRALPEFERNLKGWVSAALPLLAFLLIVIWFLASSRFSGKTRLLGLAAVVLLGFGFKAALRVDGTVDGTGLPNFVWKWSAQSQPRFSKLSAKIAESVTLSPPDPRLALAADVPQFFGSKRDGTVTGAHLAKDWQKAPPKELWRQPIGQGWSAFAVVQGRAYTQEQRGDEELVTCYDLITGKLLWAHADTARFSQWQGGDGPRATPTVEGDHVYSYGATGLLNCLDAATGKSLWQRSVLIENKLANLEWGISASPLIVEDRVIVTGGSTQGPVLFAYQRMTGAALWQAGSDQATYASPMLVALAGKRVILSNDAHALTAYDPATGGVLMSYPWGIDKWPKASQPVLAGADRIFVSAGYGMGCLMIQIKAEPEGELSATELWRGMKMKTQFNSPALHAGHLYGLDDGRAACVDVASGERLWKEGRFASGQSLLVDDLLLIQSESGPVHLLSARPESFQELGKIPALSSKTWNHPVLAGRFLLARNDREAVCYELPTE